MLAALDADQGRHISSLIYLWYYHTLTNNQAAANAYNERIHLHTEYSDADYIRMKSRIDNFASLCRYACEEKTGQKDDIANHLLMTLDDESSWENDMENA